MAGFANTTTGGLILIGFRGAKSGSVESISKVVPVPRKMVDADQYRKIIDAKIVPHVRGLTVEWLDRGSGSGILTIDIPAQPAISLPFIVPGMPSPESKLKDTVAVPIRRGDGIPQLSIAELQRLLAAGWAATGGPAEVKESTDVAADRAKAARVIAAVPADADWVKALAQQLPMKRVSVTLMEAVSSAWESITTDKVRFLNNELTATYSEFVTALSVFYDELCGMFSVDEPGGALAYFEVPPEWKHDAPDRYSATLRALSKARTDFLEKHTELLNAMNRQGLLV
ncbi:hypothetical protein [Streptomyces sp. NPDC058394]|uniref:hypothetical protein n=1 Tax=Streptomyces sp. NPDC058394 TaxID=3346477 RepID=UPI0036630B59